jgi:plastocyanin
MSRKITAVLLAVVCVAALASTAFAGGFRNVDVKDYTFSRAKLSISRGTTVVWHWKNTEAPHNVTAKRVPKGVSRFHSHTTAGNYTFRHKFGKAGTYRLECTIHDGMKQTITVH